MYEVCVCGRTILFLKIAKPCLDAYHSNDFSHNKEKANKFLKTFHDKQLAI